MMKDDLRFFFSSLGAVFFLVVSFVGSVSVNPTSFVASQVRAQEVDAEKVDDFVASARRARAGNQAFTEKNYLLAQKECELALSLNPDNASAKELSAKIQEVRIALKRSIEEGNALFELEQYAKVLETARQIRASWGNYVEADDLFRLAAQILVADGWKAYGDDNLIEASAKAEEALGFVPNDPEALKLTAEIDLFSQTKPGSRATLEYKGVKFVFRYCPAGSLVWGASENEEERNDGETGRVATFDEGFWIAETETTQAQWDAIGGDSKIARRFNGAELPIENVSLTEAVVFVKKLNALDCVPKGWRFELPTEEQWEYACRAGSRRLELDGEVLDDRAWRFGNSDGESHKVKTKRPNGWGVYDMLGNVWEWTKTKSEDGTLFVGRGGGWESPASVCSPTNRCCSDPTNCNDDLGFRCVLVRSADK